MNAPQPIWKKKATCLALLLVILIAMPGCFGGIGGVSSIGSFRHSENYRRHRDDLNALFGPHTVIDEHTTTQQRAGYRLTFTETTHHFTIEYQDVITGETHEFHHGCTSSTDLGSALQHHVEERLEPYFSPWHDAFPEDERGESTTKLLYYAHFHDEFNRSSPPKPQELIDGGLDFTRFDPALLNNFNVLLKCKATYKTEDGHAPYGEPEEFIAQCIEIMTSLREATGLECYMPVYISNASFGKDNFYRIEGQIAFHPEQKEFLFHTHEDTRQPGE